MSIIFDTDVLTDVEFSKSDVQGHSSESKAINELAQKTQHVSNMTMMSKNIGGSFGIGGEAKWGSKKGPEYNVYGKADVHDHKGNSIDFKIQQKSDGTGSISGSFKHDKKP